MSVAPLVFALAEVQDEYTRTTRKFPPFRSPHEGYAIIQEELEELWAEVKKQHDARSKLAMRGEARQVAAMAVRFMVDLTAEAAKQ